MDTPIKLDVETDPKELQKRISFEEWKIRLHKRKLQELKIQQKKIALERLEVAINTFTNGACFLKLSEYGDVVRIQFEDGRPQIIVNVNSGIEMLYNVLKHDFIGGKE
ncbi:hypothetical protein [Megasphaera lornae]|uniref:hypothetical protein n=1 Tax=Megasphaera lornae TaxID=1000568 RepID=UPI000593E191|nr:hypothetical protein [Megasphaera genomosp. type_1]